MATLAELQARRARLAEAYDALLTGERVVEFMRGGRKVVYARADMQRLKDEIGTLDAMIAELDPLVDTRPRYRGLSVRFG